MRVSRVHYDNRFSKVFHESLVFLCPLRGTIRDMGIEIMEDGITMEKKEEKKKEKKKEKKERRIKGREVLYKEREEW